MYTYIHIYIYIYIYTQYIYIYISTSSDLWRALVRASGRLRGASAALVGGPAIEIFVASVVVCACAAMLRSCCSVLCLFSPAIEIHALCRDCDALAGSGVRLRI